MFALLAELWPTLLFTALAVGYLQLTRYADRRNARPRPLTDEEYLVHLARTSGITEYEIFKQAAESWNLPASRAETDFTTYLQEGRRPHYLNDYLRKARRSDPTPRRPPFLLGGGSLPWLK